MSSARVGSHTRSRRRATSRERGQTSRPFPTPCTLPDRDRVTRLFSIALVVTLLACGKSKEASTEPAHHRVTAAACPPAPPGLAHQAPADHQEHCSADSDCRDGGADGRCRGEWHPQGSGGASFDTACIYDECIDDTGCRPTTLCDCRNTSHGQANICIAAACKRDSDCGPPGFCSASARLWFPVYSYGYPNPRPEGIEYGYFCHTPLDECFDDAECSNVDGGRTYSNHCAFDSKAGHWRCAAFTAAPD